MKDRKPGKYYTILAEDFYKLATGPIEGRSPIAVAKAYQAHQSEVVLVINASHLHGYQAVKTIKPVADYKPLPATGDDDDRAQDE